ncbi:anhydro-N-acetylmuramic acid kinase [Paraferrimonas sedimenticola]|uniref:Anhydro-N-acetylmuramic acid kinase n=1 Tax=Paraferrimonas sedimenticola TaxID=375674 RepID=A0AA37RTV1_9GAMM|nr:anhydro-N-acetylmuramic acid kinase [Paraferrimonas sedimenticola]GLP95615.1 anhydro-N-acetylmuramic acid kinase [Paraferrimonas sedimenticola]
MTQYYIGLMSGTSMDSVDAALVCFEQDKPELIAQHSEHIPKRLLNKLHQITTPGHDEINRLGQLDREVGKLFAEAAVNLIDKAGVSRDQVIAVGSHGQTVRHMPELEQGFSLQIGDPNTIAVHCGMDVIADFRRKDVALGGQGAPLVPAFHQNVFAARDYPCIIINIGGIANLTYIPPIGSDDDVIGFDTGPGNTLMDAYCRQNFDRAYDVNGELAASGDSDPQLLQAMLKHPYFAQPYPKSTGRELFNQAWLSQQLSEFIHMREQDLLSTLLDLTCASIADACLQLANKGKVLVCGGGALNPELMKRLDERLARFELVSSSDEGIDPQWVEAIAFAWLAKQYKQGKTSNLPAVTGASRAAVLGAFFPAN